MKKAYTLIELLIVAAILAILASVLFPCLAAAKQADPQAELFAHTHLIGKAISSYAADYDDKLPLAAVLRPGGRIGTGIEYPFPFNDVPYPQATWSQPGFMQMASSFWANAVLPYVQAPVDYSSPAATTVLFDPQDGVPNWNAPPLIDDLTYNGMLHHLSISAIPNPEAAVLAWPGQGTQQVLGRAAANPVLNCGNYIDDCEFNPYGDPSAVTEIPSSFSGDSLFFVPDSSTSYWEFSDQTLPYVKVDGSMHARPTGSAVEPDYIPPQDAFTDPFAFVTDTGYPGANWDCNGPATVVNNGNYSGTYWCFFRPDRKH